ncbi:MAG: energy-coupling factor transport system ATP-binding protein [Clostridiales bacterium]|nr:energy-coupling factor transport system ATP-binding protein [Clostridiales bacterium]
MNKIVQIDNVTFHYHQHQQEPFLAVDEVSMSLERGKHTAVLGRNGSGKSTLARLVNALEQPDHGTILVAGLNTSDDKSIWEIRSTCGMVFQNPDNQIVGTTVEEDVAFGPENLGVEPSQIRKLVDESLARVGLADAAQRPPHLLSGGQKQKLAIAGILAMKPKCLILDESTAMLDPVSRNDFMRLVQTLIAVEGITVINITHHMEEVLLADQVYVMDHGKIIMTGSPAEIFEQVDQIKSLGLDVPVHMEITWELARLTGNQLKQLETAEWEGAVKAVERIISSDAANDVSTAKQDMQDFKSISNKSDYSNSNDSDSKEKVISVQNLTYTYNRGTSMAQEALSDVSFEINRGELFGIIGHSGSGKSTLIQHLNGLIRPQQGTVHVLGWSVSQNADVKKIRQKAGLLFQYPEHQLFEETVFQDIAFGPKRMGLDANEIDKRVLAAAEITGLSQEILERSPFELSGGQKRRVAIAGILAMKPEILILDEPAAGLDPAGRDEILSYAAQLREMGVTVILVSHSMEDIARLADRILVLRDGKIHACGKPQEVFVDESYLRQAGLSLPRAKAFLESVAMSFPEINTDFYTPETAVAELLRYKKDRRMQ